MSVRLCYQGIFMYVLMMKVVWGAYVLRNVCKVLI